jgi:hypothetical protein
MIDPERPYIVDEIDGEAARLYESGWPHMKPPVRPTGFVDEQEERAWANWRARAELSLKRKGK